MLDRIPEKPAGTKMAEVLVIDDFFQGRHFSPGGLAHPNPDKDFKISPLSCARRKNQGYGGNQKHGYHNAIDHGLDIVALVHGDGHYAPGKAS